MTGSYFINAPSLESATSICVDAAMTIYAPNGIYQQGGIARQLVDGSLLPPQLCPTCSIPCGDYPMQGGAVVGVYKSTVNVGSGTGAVIVSVISDTVPNGFSVQYNSATYNKFSSPTYGYLAATSGATFLGTTSDDCGIVAGSPHTLNEYIYETSEYVASGNQEVINVVSGQIETTAGSPSTCIMVIPKTSASPNTIEVTVYTTCPSSDFSVEVSCPEALTEFASGVTESTETEACENFPTTNSRYVAYVNGGSGTLGLYDWVFSDANGQNILPNGYYRSGSCPAPNDIFRVENGVIVEFIECADLLLAYEVAKDLVGSCGDNITNLRLQVNYGFIPVLDVYYPDTGSIPVYAGLYTATLGFTYSAAVGGCCDQRLVLEYAGVVINSVNLPTPPVNGVYYSVSSPFTITNTQLLRGYIECV